MQPVGGELVHGDAVGLIDPAAGEHHRHRAGQDPGVAGQRPGAHVLHVERQPLGPVELVAAAHLGESGDAGPHLEALVLRTPEAGPVVHRQRTRPHQGDVALHEVPQRRQLVEARGPQPAADAGDALGVELGCLPARPRRAHRRELQQLEGMSTEAQPALAIDDAPPDAHPGGDGGRQQHRRQHHEAPDAGRHVDGPPDRITGVRHDGSSDPGPDERERPAESDRSSGRAGIPTTAAPAPTVAPSPIVMPGSTRAPSPTKAPSPTVTVPPSTAPGAMCTKSPIRQSWSTLALVLTITPSPSTAIALTTAPAISCAPGPTAADPDTIAPALIACVTDRPLSVIFAIQRLRAALS